MINFNNLYKLNTSEDSSYIHKSLGIICMYNFAYRYVNYLFYGTMNLQNSLGISSILLHGVLSISSFIFHIPKIRNPSKPMIYPEFRLHSILFAIRSVLSCLIHYYNFHYIYLILTCYLTMIFADIVSYNIPIKNDKTMRNMPFEDTIKTEDQSKIILMQSLMQIGATTFMLGNIESAFSPLFGIQLGAFLMTLVRKSIISTKSWHYIYTLSLWINIILFYSLSLTYIIFMQIVYNNFKLYFFPNKINKYLAWTFNFILFILYKELNIEYINIFINHYGNVYDVYINIIKILIIIYIYYTLFIRYKFLFI